MLRLRLRSASQITPHGPGAETFIIGFNFNSKRCGLVVRDKSIYVW